MRRSAPLAVALLLILLKKTEVCPSATQGLMKQGLKHGVWSETLPSGMRARGDYDYGQKKGHWTYWNKSCKIIMTKYFSKGKLDGQVSYYYDNNEVAMRGAYVEGKKDGIWIGKTPEGNVSSKGHYRENKKHGKWTYFTNGTVQSQGEYNKGVKRGRWEIYSPKKGLETKVYKEKKEKTQPKWELYWDNGQKRLSVSTKNGRRHGMWTSWHSNGQISSQGTYRWDKKEGEWIFYNKNGKIFLKEFYGQGIKIRSQNYK